MSVTRPLALLVDQTLPARPRVLNAEQARAAGLATTQQLAPLLRLTEHGMKQQTRLPGFPAQVGSLIRPGAGRRPALYDAAQVHAWALSQGAGLDELRISTSPRRVGTRTTTIVGRGYHWRDARRTRPAPAAASSSTGPVR